MELALSILLLLQVVDIYTTSLILKKKVGYERNPLVRKLIGLFGVNKGLLVAKCVALVAVIPLYQYGSKELVALLVVVYLLILNNNLSILRKK